MPHPNTEDQLVEQPAVQLFAELGWETVSASDEVMGRAGTLGRETSAQVVIENRLHAALERLNPTAPRDAIALAIDALARNRSTMSLVAANREVYVSCSSRAFPSRCPTRSTEGRRLSACA